MRRFALRLAVALLTFALGVLIAAVRNELRLRVSLSDLFPSTHDATVKNCSEHWENASTPSQMLGWDLTYYSVLTQMKVCPSSEICKEWAKPAPPIQQLVSQWQGDPIVSSFEFEFPDGHASMFAAWFIRTRDHAYYWGFYPLDTDYTGGKHLIPTQDYDTVFETLSCWQQVEPRRQTFGSEGYVGFLSLYKEGKSRQMLLTYEDFIEGGKYPEDGDVRPGAFSRVVDPLISPLRGRPREVPD